jgi:nucleoside 2-deoxyribosyltransferase
MIVYLAAPFFNSAQNATVSRIETVLEAFDFDVISPRRSGLILKDMSAKQREEAASHVYNKNVEDLERCNTIFAVIDDRDSGVMWEMGYGAARGKAIYSYSDSGYGLNVMLTGCVRGHARGMEQLKEMLDAIKKGADTSSFAIRAST